MRILFDTHCWLWSETAPDRISAKVRDLLVDPDNELLLSAASAWEVAIKHALGKLPLPEPPASYVPSRMARNRITGLPILLRHVLLAGSLPGHHRDPFDRLLAAQAQLENLTLLTADRQFEPYGLQVLWA